ncbi:MAG: fused DSP-PTPase phosphatase/NAD kinase-like protein [Ignavibacteria bacterium]
MAENKAFLLLLFLFCIVFRKSEFYASEYRMYDGADSVILLLDDEYNNPLPQNFRTCTDSLKSSDVIPDITGLSSLRVSGSAQFWEKNLSVMKDVIGAQNITIVDLRQESHGFVNGMPVSWYGKYDWANLGMTGDEVILDERQRLDSLLRKGSITISEKTQKNKSTGEITGKKYLIVEVETVSEERETAEKYGFSYFRIAVTDHRSPGLKDVNRFVEFVRGLPEDAWLHFHCHAGDGRTTTFMAMYDMMRNAKKAELKDILQRQYLLGGIDLSKDDDFPEYDRQYAIERTEFLGKFYLYCKSNSDNYKTGYSEHEK